MHLTKGLYPFWDDLMTDIRVTDAALSVNRPQRIENVFKTDEKWEGNQSDFFSIIREKDFFRMYYLGTNHPASHPWFICYAESKDGINWVKPKLDIFEFEGSKDNNIILEGIGGGFAMYDTNPNCPEDEKYKIFGPKYNDHEDGFYCDLVCFTSRDGIHFEKHHIFEAQERYNNMYDSLNTVYFDNNDNKYYAFIRTNHSKPINNPKYDQDYARSITVLTSEDCVHWSKGISPNFMGAEDVELYTNCISPYIYDSRYYIGFPTRYVERKIWDDSFEELTAKEWRLERMKNPNGEIKDNTARYGLAITDCLFMSSRDKFNWYRFDEACLTPGPEDGYNWEYGDCYPAVGLIETPGRFKGTEPELSLFCESHHWTDKPVELIRYVFRKDGFASYKAPYKEKTLRTKEFTFEGDKLYINFKTSARGYVKVSFLDDKNNPIEGYESAEHFGDTTKRYIKFSKNLSLLKDKKVKLDFKLFDAEIFSFTLD